MFRRDVGTHAGKPDETCARRCVDDRTTVAVFEDAWDLILHAEEDAGEHHTDAAVPFLLGIVGDGESETGDARVVVGIVEAAERLDRGLDHGTHVGRLRHVGVHVAGTAARSAHERRCLIAADVVDIGDHDRRAVLCEELRRRPADAGCRAGNERDLAVEHPHRALPLGARSFRSLCAP